MIVAATSAAVGLLAHQGGWDEALLIAGPIVAIVGLLMLAKRRVDAASAAEEWQEQGGPEDHGRDASTARSSDGTRSMSAPTERSRPTRSS